jgi:PS-10 peptidase S37
MVRQLAWAVVLLAGACGDNIKGPDPNDPATLLAELQALPNVHDVTEMPTSHVGYHYFVLHFTQPVDHADPGGQTFLEEVSLIHADVAAPLVIHTSGYWDYYLDTPVEPTVLLGANQISIEHRFFGTSRPDPADWTKLTIEQMADDEHAIVASLATIYRGAKLSTGGSKGGMTAMFYRRFFPGDVDGTLPYVAPISYAAPDPRYVPYLEQVGDAACRAQVRAVAVAMLQTYRADFVADAQSEAIAMGYTYTRVAIGPAVESAIVSLEWTFWQYYGESYCTVVPDPGTTTSDDLYAFLDMISPVSASDDEQDGELEAYDYQAYFQLGYPDDGTEDYLKPYEMYTDADYTGYMPQGVAMPTYDGGAAMQDIASWVASDGDRLLFAYGQWDPWSGGMYALGSAADSAIYVEPAGTHDSDLVGMGASDEAAAFAMLADWTGVTPMQGHAVRLRAPRFRHRVVAWHASS